MTRISTRNIILLLIPVGVSLILSGCKGAGDKWINTVNTVSSTKMSGRYVTRSKSVKIQSQEIGLKVDVGLPDSLPRVSSSRIEFVLKRFAFGPWVSTVYSGWVADLAAATSVGKCASLVDPVTVESTFTESEKADVPIPIKSVFSQMSDGVVSVEVIGAGKGAPLVAKFRSNPVGTGEAVCVVSWKPEGELKEFVEKLIALRAGLVDELKKEVGFDGTNTGTRLSRVRGEEVVESTDVEAKILPHQQAINGVKLE